MNLRKIANDEFKTLFQFLYNKENEKVMIYGFFE